MSYKKRDLPIGNKFNKLTIIEEIPTNEKCRRYAYCLCECGSKKVIRYDMLSSGRIKSCGCLLSIKNKSQIEKMLVTRRRNKEKVIVENYIGKRFTKLTVRNTQPHPKIRGTWFILDCDCGNTIHASLSKLKKNHVRSCGCIRRKFDQVFISEIDGEKITASGGRLPYFRILGNREQLHVYEAKKLFKLKNMIWNDKFIVHHCDGDKKNNSLNNLAVLENNGTHHKHHAKMEIAMYSFMKENNLLAEFYAKNSNLQLTTLDGLI
jgi:hypothetical protein